MLKIVEKNKDKHPSDEEVFLGDKTIDKRFKDLVKKYAQKQEIQRKIHEN